MAGILLFPALQAKAALQAEYFDGRNFNTPLIQRVEPNVDFQWGSGSPDGLVNGDEFSARWTGLLTAPGAGTYTIWVVSDNGSRLRLNGAVVSDHLDTVTGTETGWFPTQYAFSAGQKVPFQLEYYETTGNAEIALYWQSENQAFQLIPASAFSLAPVSGWMARYFDGRTFERPVAGIVEPIIEHDWNSAPLPQLYPDNFSVKWSGCFTPAVTGVYDFTIAADNGTRLWLNGVLVSDDWNPADGQNGGWRTVSVPLTGGQPVIALLDYYQAWGGASAALYWSSSNHPLELLGGSHIKPVTANQAPFLKPFEFQNSKTGDRVDLPLISSDVEGDPVTFSVSGLPPGVNIVTTAVPGSNPRGISPVTNVSLAGRPTRSGIYPVTVTATTPDGAHVESSFMWTVRGPAIAALSEVQEWLQCSLTIFPTGSGLWVSYTVPGGIGA